MTHHTNVRLGDRGKSPQLPAFCRTRRPITTTVRVSTLQQLLWLLWLVLALQLSTVLLVIAGPVPASVRPAMPLVLPPDDPLMTAQLAASGAMPTDELLPRAIAPRHSAQLPSVPSSFQP